MSIIARLYTAVKDGSTLQAAIDLIVPGADPAFWELKLRNYDPNTKSKNRPRRTCSGSRKVSQRSFRADSVLTRPGYFKQETQRYRATTELVDRTNGQEPETDTILFTANDEFQGIMEVAS